MENNKTPKSQRNAVKAYEQRNPEKMKYLKYRTTARTFVRHYATKEDIEELIEIFKKEKENYK